jgi:hypothetical protein
MKKSPSASRALTLRQERALTAKEFLDLADVPPEVEWFANITNPQTRRAYQNDLGDFMRFAGIENPEEFPHSIAFSGNPLCLSRWSRDCNALPSWCLLSFRDLILEG